MPIPEGQASMKKDGICIQSGAENRKEDELAIKGSRIGCKPTQIILNFEGKQKKTMSMSMSFIAGLMPERLEKKTDEREKVEKSGSPTK